jgi:prevent-host-death family protein
MAVVNVRELSRNTSRVIGNVTKSGRPTLITRAGKPVAAILAVEADDWEDWVLANASEFVASMREADNDARHGRTITLDEYIAARKRVRRRPHRAEKAAGR